jgi:hypothetical protein
MYETLPLTDPDESPAAEAGHPDPYDGVALGVECAWPSEAPRE